VIHRQQILSVLKRFKSDWKTPVSEIETEQLQKVLSPLSGATRNRYIRTLNALWTFALKKEYTKANPVANLDRVHLDKKPTQTFSNKEVEGMLNEAFQSNLAMVPYFAFGSIRRT
jgi:site-specific recombinase XerD